MTFAVDSNIIFDVLLADSEHGPWSRGLLGDLSSRGRLIACEVVWAETSAGFANKAAFSAQMAAFGISFSPISAAAAMRAGAIWRAVRAAQAGRARGRQQLIPDFLVGAHALECADALVTRDRGFLRACFAELTVIDPTDDAWRERLARDL